MRFTSVQTLIRTISRDIYVMFNGSSLFLVIFTSFSIIYNSIESEWFAAVQFLEYSVPILSTLFDSLDDILSKIFLKLNPYRIKVQMNFSLLDTNHIPYFQIVLKDDPTHHE